MADYRREGPIAILEANNPPVNALSYKLRKGLYDGIKTANADPKVKAVVIIGKGRTFPAGADIREFDSGTKAPWLTQVGDALEASEKPVVSAIHGTALGGGLEIALFTHYRIALKSARVGFPEVLLGLLPGAAGTQRLPRVADVSVAMEMIASGRHVPAPQALKYGILDKIVDGDLLQEAMKFAQSVVGQPLEKRRLRSAPVIGANHVVPAFDAAMKQVKLKQKGFLAPIFCLKTVRNAAELPYEQGVEKEAQLFSDLMSSSQSRALRYAFFAERSAQQWRMASGASSQNTKPLAVKTTGVIGAGTMGTGIAVSLLRAGFPVVLVEQNQKLLEKGVAMIEGIFKDSVRRKLMTEDGVRTALGALRPSVDLNQLANVDLVIEAVFENVALKQDIFRKLETICKSSAVLCTNTSTISIEMIASATSCPDRVVGTHFFAPAHVMKLLENIYTEKTSPQTVATVMDLGKKIGKVSVLVKTCHGFVANRMHGKWATEAQLMLEEGALPQDVDRVLEDFGMPIGPLKVADLSGLDIGWRIRRELAKMKGVELTPQTRFFQGERYTALPDKLVELGRLGRKSGKGWYRYDKPGGRVAIPDEEVTAIIHNYCKESNIPQRQISSQEILERCMYAAINEGFRILEEGVASKPEDIDVIWWYGFGFPRYMGGPMFYASMAGVKQVYERICYYHEHFPYSAHWVPSDLLRKLATAEEPAPITKWVPTLRSAL